MSRFWQTWRVRVGCSELFREKNAFAEDTKHRASVLSRLCLSISPRDGNTKSAQRRKNDTYLGLQTVKGAAARSRIEGVKTVGRGGRSVRVECATSHMCMCMDSTRNIRCNRYSRGPHISVGPRNTKNNTNTNVYVSLRPRFPLTPRPPFSRRPLPFSACRLL